MSEPIHFPLLIKGPKNPPITVEQHKNLSVFGLASFMITYPIVIADMGDHVILYCEEWKGNYYHEMPRFAEVIPGRIYGSVEMAKFTIPKTTKLYATIHKYFPHLCLLESISQADINEQQA